MATRKKINEMTAAAATLAPQAAPGESRAQLLSTFVQMLSQLGKEDLSNLFNSTLAATGYQVPTAQTQAPAAQPSSAVGSGALPPMPMQEDVEEMFEGHDLSEEFKQKAGVIFEAAVNARVNLETVRLEEEYQEVLDEEIEAIHEELTGSVVEYMDYIAEQWLEKNAIAIETSMRAQIAENFMEGLRDLYSEHYISIPDDKVDVLEDLVSELEETESRLNEEIEKNMELEQIVESVERELALEEVSEGLVMTDAERLRNLAEGVSFENADEYTEKLNIIKDQYFNNKVRNSTNLIQEEIAHNYLYEPKTNSVQPDMSGYVSAIAKTAKN